MKQGTRVMVVDDESIVCERLMKHLTGEGFEVETFTDSAQAIERLDSGPAFEVVVTDLKMKGPTGLDVMHHVSGNSPGTQVIIITGYASIEAAREAEYTGVFDFINKPFKLETMAALVKKAAKKAGKDRRFKGGGGA
ncbi:MAG: response regulator [Deltaproteobacteria bacterium]|nr:response regulator [Deltaproteobacteria bacterium]